MRIFVTDDLPGLGAAINKLFPESGWQLCVLHAVREGLAQARKNDREALAPDLKVVYRAEDLGKGMEVLRNLKARWGGVYPRMVEKWEKKAGELLAFLDHPREIRRYLYTTNQLEGLTPELERRTEVVESFSQEEAPEILLYLALSEVNERPSKRRLRVFAEITRGCYHAA